MPDRRPRDSMIAAALVALVAAGVVALWLPGAIERAPARGKAFEIPAEENQDPAKVLEEARRALEKAEAVTIHWLFFTQFADDKMPADVRGKPRFHGYPILGSAAVKSKQAGQQILQSVLAEVNPDPESLTGCFDPQHGIEVKLEDGRAIDLVICYHCWQMLIFDESENASVSIGTASEPLLTEQLKAGGVEFVDRLGLFLQSLREASHSSAPSTRTPSDPS